MEQVSGTFSQNKVVVITGCDSGIGLELARQISSWGFSVVACCLNTESEGAKQLARTAYKIFELDVCSEKLVNKLVKDIEIIQDDGKEIWCLINNAGKMSYAKSEWQTWDVVQSQILINLSGAIQMTRSLMPFIKLYRGRIINISSPQGLIASPYMSVYCASKWGLESFSQALRREVYDSGVKVVVVRPCNIPHKTNILKHNSTELKKMKRKMTKNAIYLDNAELDAMIQTFEMAYSNTDETQEIKDVYLLDAIKCALISKNPRRSYLAAPLYVRMLLYALTLLPQCILDFLVRWEVPNKIISLATVE